MTASRAPIDCDGFECRDSGQIQLEFMVFSLLKVISDPFRGSLEPSRRTSRASSANSLERVITKLTKPFSL